MKQSHTPQAKVKLEGILERVSTVDGNGGEGGRLESDYLDDLFAVILSIELVSNYDLCCLLQTDFSGFSSTNMKP